MSRCSCIPVNVIIFEIQHLYVCCKFSCFWQYFVTWVLWAAQHLVDQKRSAKHPFLGCDLILGTAAAGPSRLTAIQLGMILKMLGMRKIWRCQTAGRLGAGGSGSGREGSSSNSLPSLDSTFRLSRFSVTDQSATFPSTFHISMPHLLWWALPDTNRLWSTALDRCWKFFSLHSYSCLLGVICWQ